jgi:Family of unknown function (DUF6418)
MRIVERTSHQSPGPVRSSSAAHASPSAFGLIVPTVFVLGVLTNAALPYLGLEQASAVFTLVLASLALIGLVVVRPVFSVSMLYLLAISLSAFVAGVGIEAGGLLIETGVEGEANGAFSRLFLFYLVFVVCALFSFERILNERTIQTPVVARMTIMPASVMLGLGLAAAIIGAGVLAGLTEGFALLKGVNRFALRNDSAGAGPLFNLFLNNQLFLAVLLGTFCTGPSRSLRCLSIFMIVVDIGLEVLHGEQFMSVLDVCLCVLIPFVAIHAINGKPVVRYLGIGAAFALLLGGASVFYAYKGQGLDMSDTVMSRVLLQGQVWYVVDNDAHLFSAPLAGGAAAFSRFVGSLTSMTAPTFFDDGAASGLRDLMLSYGTPEILQAYTRDDVTFTMGQMAVPVYWFGFAGGAVFVAVTGAIYGALSAVQILLAARGGVVMLWLITKVVSYATFAMQQGEYWTLFGSRTVLYALAALLWWYCVDARGARLDPMRTINP